MREDWPIMVKKLALAYETGWEYQPESEEPGSVLTDIFLEMEEKNSWRLKKIWGKHERAFLEVVPERKEEPRKLKAALSVKTSDAGDGKRLEAGARVYTMTENGALLNFRTDAPLQLTAARLRWVIRRSGLCAWRCYEEGDAFPILLAKSQERELAHPVFCWQFRGICDGHSAFSFAADFGEEAELSVVPPGNWTVSDGRNAYPAEWTLAEGRRLLSGECPAFAQNLEGMRYELRMELPAEELLKEPMTEEWLRELTGSLVLKEKEETLEPERCLTENGSGSSRRTLPFGREPETASCFYLACDRAAAGAQGGLILRFSESFETEERLPEPEPEGFEKQYKKYPWMRRAEKVQEWKAEETVWEYFDGSMWRILPGSENWRTGCQAENGRERSLCFAVPSDMQPCAVDGEEHLYLRLRIERVQGAYAAYYRKRIPVLENIRFCVGERSFRPEESDLPDVREASDCSIYLGFDREVTCDNRWYTGRVGYYFTQEQIKGPGLRYGKKAYWVELPRDVEEIDAMLPNYVEICQETAEDGRSIQQRIPEKTVYYVEADEMGVLEAISVSEAHYDESGAPVQSEKEAAVHYFQHFDRLLTPMDLELLMQERYPFLKLGACLYRQEDNQLEVTLIQPHKKAQKQGEVNLSEIQAWLRNALRQMGALWLQDAEVKCILQNKEQQRQQGEGEK